MTDRTKNLISRLTLASLALVTLYAAYRVSWATYGLYIEAQQLPTTARRRGTLPVLPILVSLGLTGLGLVFALGSAIPTRWISKVISPPDLRLHERPDSSGPFKF